MSMGLVSNDEFEAEIANTVEYKSTNNKGRGVGTKNVPMAIRKIASETALIEGRTAAIAEELGISKASVDAYAHGATSCATYNEPHPELNAHLDKVRDETTSTARQKLKLALEQITADKLEKAKLKDASSIARDMSTIIKNLEPPVKPIDETGTKFVFLVPPMKKIEQFEIIDVHE